MEIKIQLPNPDDYKMQGEQWFSQMRISLKAAEKTYQEAIKNLTEEDKKNEDICPWVRFTLSYGIVEAVEKAGYPDINEDVQKDLFIQIASL